MDDLPPNFKSLFRAASRLIAVRLETLVDAVFESELRLEKWAGNDRRLKQVTMSPRYNHGLTTEGEGAR